MEAPICGINTDHDAESRDVREFCTAVVVTVVGTGVVVVVEGVVVVGTVKVVLGCIAGSVILCEKSQIYKGPYALPSSLLLLVNA